MENINKYPPRENWGTLIKRPIKKAQDLRTEVSSVFAQVQKLGDKALFDLTQKYDGVQLKELKVSEKEIRDAIDEIPDDLKQAILQAKENIDKFHSAQKEIFPKIETTPGVFCWRESRAIHKVGLYIPGGSAPLFSTVLMLGVPANIAGCGEIILCTPPQKDGRVNAAVLFSASLCGITQIYKIGGSQAIAAMSLGKTSVPKVDKIFGPGNQYVTQAKQIAQEYGVAIDLPAGPSEVLVIADESAIPAFCAADLLAQAEHGADSQVVFIATDEKIFVEILSELENQLNNLSRKDISTEAISKSRFILLDNIEDALELSNLYAPEHLILSINDAEQAVDKVFNAGSVFLGNYTPESAGDYASGTNHTLPTNGYARNYSGVSLESFQKKITVQKITAAGIMNLGKTVEIMAEAEGLDAHKNAVSIRLKYLQDEI